MSAAPGVVMVLMGEDPAAVEVRVSEAEARGQYALVDIGGTQFHVSQASPAFLRALSAAFAEAADWRERQAVKAVA